MTPKKVLVVVSDQGFHWDELADAFHVFRDAHWQVELASPLGHPKADALTLRPSPFLHWLGRGTTQSRLPATSWWGRPVIEAVMRAKRLEFVDLGQYDAFYLVGGLGEVEDLKANPHLAELLRHALAHGQWVAGLKRILGYYRTLDGDPLVSGRVIFAKNPKKARHAAWRLVEAVVAPEDVHGKLHVAEFLDRKWG